MFPPDALPYIAVFTLLHGWLDLWVLRSVHRDPDDWGRPAAASAVVSLLLTLVVSAPAFDRFALITLICHAVFLHAPLLALGLAARARGGALVLLPVSALLVGVAVDAFLIEPVALEVNHHTLTLEELTEPVTVVVLADIQTDEPDDGHTRRALEAAMAQEPDLILLAGDYLQRFTWADYRNGVEPFRSLVQDVGLTAPLGVFAVQGNVDKPGLMEGLFEGTDVQLFSETTQRVLGPVTVTALSFSDGFDRRLELPDPGGVHIVLAHGPDYALGAVHADLLVAGHTHGGQLQLPAIGPLMTLSKVPRDWAAGLTTLASGATLVVSRGIGMERHLAPRFRFLCRPEVVVLHLEPSHGPR